jgi:hypothetical protein
MLIKRFPGLENSFCKHDATQSTPPNAASPIVCEQGVVVTATDCDGETTVVKQMDSCSQVPFGLLMQHIRTEYNHEYVPQGGMMKRDLGTQTTFVGAPVAVAHHGIWSTNVYDTDVAISAGDFLYASASGTLVKSTGWGVCASGNWSGENPVAVALNTLTTARMALGRYLHIKLLI